MMVSPREWTAVNLGLKRYFVLCVLSLPLNGDMKSYMISYIDNHFATISECCSPSGRENYRIYIRSRTAVHGVAIGFSIDEPHC